MRQLSLSLFLITLFMVSPVLAQEEETKNADTTKIVKQVVKANSEFGFDLYRQLAKENKNLNIFISPYSVSNMFAMVREGAKGNTADEMTKTLKLTDLEKSNAKISVGYRELNKQFNQTKKPYQLHTLNGQWVEKTYPFLPRYQQILSKQYGATLFPADFIGNYEAERKKINIWVEKKSNKLLKNFLPEQSVNSLTRVVLINATYFKAQWNTPFKVKATKKENFILFNGKKTKIALMNQYKQQFGYAHLTKEGKAIPLKNLPNDKLTQGGFQIVELPYITKIKVDENSWEIENDISMLIILPNEINGLPELEKNISPEKLNLWLKQIHMQQIDLAIPKFTFHSSYNLIPTLSSLGMKDLFSVNTNLRGMNRVPKHPSLFTGFALHKSFIKVDEVGTEASSIVVFGGVGGIPPAIPKFRADHPFLFLIRDHKTNTILFLGRLMNPNG